MKKLSIVLCLAAGVVLLGGNALAQGDNSYYFVTYYSNANTKGAPDGVLRLVNDGGASTYEIEGIPGGSLYASVYVFDDSQELQECCNCYISPDGLLSESVDKGLTANTLTGKVLTRGVIKVISSSNYDPTDNVPQPGIWGWMTQIQKGGPTGPAWPVVEAPLADSNLSAAELSALQSSCSFAITLGSGHGICSCTAEDSDF